MFDQRKLKDEFLLNKEITYLNFGAFGACPKPVFEDYQHFQLELEKDPTDFITNKGLQYLQHSREHLAAYLNCHSDDIVYVTNPTYAVNIIAKSLKLETGDEILTTNLEYGACDKTWEYYCKKSNAEYVKHPVQLPIQSKETFIEEFCSSISPRTKLIFISHITSSTGLILPVEEITRIANNKGIPIMIDGAHAAGQLNVNLSELNADIYTGACHKWMLTPKGASFLYVKKEMQHSFDPLMISWGYNSVNPSHSLFLDYHQLQGTRDFSAFLTIPKAISFMNTYNWSEVNAYSRNLTQSNTQRFCDLFNTQPLAPVNSHFIAQLFSIPVKTTDNQKIHQLLYKDYKIQIPVTMHNGNYYIRYSIQGFNTQDDLNTLYYALEKLKEQNYLQGF